MKKSIHLALPATGQAHTVTMEANVTVGDLLRQMKLEDHEILLERGAGFLARDFGLFQLPENTWVFAATEPVV